MRSFRRETLAQPPRGRGRSARTILPVDNSRERGRSALHSTVPWTRRSRCLARLGQHWIVTTLYGAASPVPYHLREFVETGRSRLILLALSTFLAGAAILYAMYDPDRLWAPPEQPRAVTGSGVFGRR